MTLSELYHQLYGRLLQATQVGIVGHQSPDGDSVGSTLAVSMFLHLIGVKNQVIHPDPVPKYLLPLTQQKSFIDFQSNPNLSADYLSSCDLILCLDFNAPNRCGDLAPFLDRPKSQLVVIDHHLNPSDFADLLISQPEESSTCQLIYDFIMTVHPTAMNSDIGRLIYLGIMTDTGSFRFPSVQPKTHHTLAHLLEIGVKSSQIHEAVYDQSTLHQLRLRSYAINQKLTLHHEAQLAIIALNLNELKEYHYESGDTEGLVNVALGIIGVKMAVLVKESEDKVKLSFRSKGDVFVNTFAANYFNGGGHQYAAGGKSFDSVDETVDKIIQHAKEYL